MPLLLRGVLLVLAAWLGLALPALAGEDVGRRIEFEHVAAAGLPEQRLTIWLPPGYDQSKRRYSVVYMHDGHNLFDLKSSNFNKIWAADKAMLAAMRTGKVAPRNGPRTSWWHGDSLRRDRINIPRFTPT